MTRVPAFVILMLSVCVATLLADVPDEPSFRRYGVVTLGPGASVGVGLPDPLTSADLAHWVEVLELGPEAAEAMRKAVDEFYEVRDAQIQGVLEPVERAARDLARVSGLDLQRLPDGPERFEDLVRLRNRSVSQLKAIEEDLFVAVAMAIAPDEAAVAAVAATIRQLRSRSRYRTTPARLPQARIDLRAVELGLSQESPLEIVDVETWSAALLSHDAELAKLEERRVRVELDRIADDLRFFRDSGHDVEALVEHRTRRIHQQLAVERAIIAANERWTEALAQTMSPTDAQRWRDAVRAATYPTLYPNPVDLRRLQAEVQEVIVSAEVIEETGEREDSEEIRELRSIARSIAAEITRLAEIESALESELMSIAVAEARHVTARGLRSIADQNIARLHHERCEAAARALELCRDAPRLRELPELPSLLAAIGRHCGDSDREDAGTSSTAQPEPMR